MAANKFSNTSIRRSSNVCNPLNYDDISEQTFKTSLINPVGTVDRSFQVQMNGIIIVTFPTIIVSFGVGREGRTVVVFVLSFLFLFWWGRGREGKNLYNLCCLTEVSDIVNTMKKNCEIHVRFITNSLQLNRFEILNLFKSSLKCSHS